VTEKGRAIGNRIMLKTPETQKLYNNLGNVRLLLQGWRKKDQ
jgi:hypothetical protein